MGAGEIVALIAGAGRLPVILARAVKARGHGLVCVTVEGDGQAVGQIADAAYVAAFGEIERIVSILRSHQVRRAMFAGRVSRARMVGEGDAAFRRGLLSLGDRRDQTVFQRVVIDFLVQHGVEVISPLEFIGDLLVREGVLTQRAPSEAEWEDIRTGMTLARSLAALDVGQTVVLKHGIPLAIEAAEGTDATIRRGGDMVEGTVVVKAARPHQDDRFDLPTIGRQTIETLQTATASALALEASRTLLLDREECLAAADRAGIAIVGIKLPLNVGG